MSSRHDYRSTDASAKDQTRPATATSDSGRNLSDGLDAGAGNRKRKRGEDTAEDLLKDSFVVRPYPPKPPNKTHTLQPLVLLPRSQLSLSSLDFFCTSNALPQSRLFETHVKVLELEERMGTQPMVLIARLDDGRSLYAVEREDRGLYAICKLGSWVNLQQLKMVAAAAVSTLPESVSRRFDLSSVPQSGTTIQTGTTSTKFSKKKRLAIEAIQSMVKRPTTDLLPNTELTQSSTSIREVMFQTPEVVDEEPLVPSSQQPLIENEPSAVPTATEIFDNVRSQYFDALYLSKASLAYFAKGPLSRARAAFHLDYESTLEMNELIAFLESLVMPTSLLDKKYKEGLPECISMIDIEDHSGEDATKPKAKKKRPIKKTKAAKNGLYPTEDENVRKWWANHEDDFEIGTPGRTLEDVTKSRLSSLRIRETQLQMVLILEVLALKPLASVVEEGNLGLPGDSQVSAPEKLKKVKKQDNLATLMDVHIDRLCIWQSLSSESTKAVASGSQAQTNVTKHTDNITRDFCVDIIAPFFSARLPEQCVAINKKLGGPVNLPPPKKQLARSASASGSLSRPGAATKRPITIKPRKSLTRILSDERERERRSASAQPNRKISLLRSATMPVMPGLKREGSEVSLSSIPTAESQPLLAANKGGFTNTKRFGHREVDFASLNRDPDAKAKKQASIDDELKNAIAALKKPNRELAGKTFAETVEQRILPTSLSRKSKKPVRNPLFQGVQISATPKSQRQTDVYSKSFPQGLPPKQESFEYDCIPPSSVPRVPQSSLPSREQQFSRKSMLATVQATPSRKASVDPRYSGTPLIAQSSVATQQTPNLLLSMVQATPSRKFNSDLRTSHLYSGSEADPSHPPSSPVHVRRSSAVLFTSVPDSAVKGSTTKSASKTAESFHLQETPIKKRAASIHNHSHPVLPALGIDKENFSVARSTLDVMKTTQLVKTPEESIYKSLGWDDGDDIDELA